MQQRRLVIIARDNLFQILQAVGDAVTVNWNPKQEALSGTLCTVGDTGFHKVTLPIANVSQTVETGIRQAILPFAGTLAAYALRPVSKAEPKLVVFDTDSTFINQEVIDEIAAYAGFKQEVSEITERAMRGELDFNQALAERVLLLRGVADTVLPEIKRSRLSLTQGAAALIADLQKHNASTYLLSGGFSFFTSAFRRELNMTGDFANELEIVDGRLTGKTLGSIVNRQRKAELLAMLMQRHGIGVEHTVAVGDGANDIDMVLQSGLGIAFCAKPALVNVTNAAIFERDLRFVAELAYS